jgi:hypothetical protein
MHLSLPFSLPWPETPSGPSAKSGGSRVLERYVQGNTSDDEPAPTSGGAKNRQRIDSDASDEWLALPPNAGSRDASPRFIPKDTVRLSKLFDLCIFI